MESSVFWKTGLSSIAQMFQRVEWGKSAREVYQQIARELLTVASCDSVNIRLLALTGDAMIGYVYAGEAETIAKAQFPTLPMSVGRMSTVFEECKPLVYDFNSPEEADLISEEGIRLGYTQAVVVPMIDDGAPIGAIDFMFKREHSKVSEEELDFLFELCKILGSVSGALSLADKTLEIRVREEAQRIGSELHDNFGQPLSVIALEADKALFAKHDDDKKQLSESLNKIATLSRQTFGMMSDEVAMLHFASMASEDLVDAVREYVTSFQNQWGMHIDLSIPEGEHLVSNNVGNQAMRILHEALSNVLRHSHTTSAAVKLIFGPTSIILSIEDRGCGFNAKDRAANQLGIQIMKDRAESIGGRVTIASVVGEGTTVVADIPLMA